MVPAQFGYSPSLLWNGQYVLFTGGSHLDLLNALDAATEEFGRRVALVGLDDWDRPTPCPDWDVHYLVAHVVGGNRFAVLILGGMDASDAVGEVMSMPQLGGDPLSAWASTSAAQMAAFRDENAAGQPGRPSTR